MKWLWFAYQNVLRNRRRSLMIILIIAISSAAILLSNGFALYTYDNLREGSALGSGHVVIAHSDYFDKEEETPMEYGLPGYKGIEQQIEPDERIRMAIPRLQFSGLISNGDKSMIFIGMGLDPERQFNIVDTPMEVLAGNILTTRHAPDALPQVMLAKDLAKQLHTDIGAVLTLLTTTADGALNALDVQVQGIFPTGSPEMDKRLLWVALPTAQELIMTDKVSTLSVYLHETDQTDAMWAVLAKQYPNLAMQPWWEQAFFYFKVKALYNIIFGVMGIIILLIVFFTITNTLSMTIVERTRETGTLLALGTLPRQIMRNFALEAFLIGLAGAVLGMFIAGATSITLSIVDIQMPPPPGSTEGYPLYIHFSLWLYGITTVLVVFLSIGAALLTSRKAARKPIVEALAHV
uniref:Putative ABC transport system permease protein n=1 Tax=Candidatus Kentrum sp. TUN TaxID=2126343 RepID=A0A450ZI42_9GAMM|nr:MAG: putative ABC transport system permease protein [Candidatus Kentron sp. TUN]VFK53439.1 MAG: putative ABC transport system permease protein [Candidatus Kentron sp. TUN]VFK59958.1 MAG: putative ABC transport system permease protein [Candidatus Kentron sp. TUN]